MLFNELMDFFITYVFGGVDSHNVIHNVYLWYINQTTINTRVQVGDISLPIGNYLAFICSIISIIIILVLCCLFIKKIISLMSRLFSGGTL